jgi:hypothetical protein
MLVFRDEVSRPAVQIRKIAPPAAGYQDFSARLSPMLEQRHAPSAQPRRGRAHQPRRPRAEHNHIELARGAQGFGSE